MRLVPQLLMAALLLAVLAGGMGVGGCAEVTPYTAEPAENQTETTSIEFLVPGEYGSGEFAGISGKYWFPVLVEVSNFKLVDKLGEPNVEGEGHIHFFFDVLPAVEAGKPAVTATGTYADTSAPYHYWHNIGEGEHVFSAELVNNDHTPLSPPVLDMITINDSFYWDG